MILNHLSNHVKGPPEKDLFFQHNQSCQINWNGAYKDFNESKDPFYQKPEKLLSIKVIFLR